MIIIEIVSNHNAMDSTVPDNFNQTNMGGKLLWQKRKKKIKKTRKKR